MNLRAMNNDGTAVDWWFMYKISGKSKTKAGAKIPRLTGAEYVYFDSSEGSSAKLIRPNDLVTTKSCDHQRCAPEHA
jgi:hypothetical protein